MKLQLCLILKRSETFYIHLIFFKVQNNNSKVKIEAKKHVYDQKDNI